jgi:membrane-associated phospholipid phosphatase
MASILDKVRLPASYPFSWARVVSDVLSPPAVWATMAVPIALRDAENSRQAWLWAGDYIFFVCVLPILYIAWLVKRGAVTDIHLKLRHQRTRPFIASIGCAVLAIITLYWLGASQVMLVFAVFTLIQLSLIAIITLTWQISVHAMSISGAAAALGVLFNPVLLAVILPLVLLVGMARIKLNRHTPAQVAVGTVVGALTPMVLFLFVAIP